MVKNFRELQKKMRPEAREHSARLAQEYKREMPLHELRRAREFTQARLAESLDINQGEVSKIEKRTDMYLSTLRSYIEAMGGELELKAKFPDGSVDLIIEQEVNR